MTAYCDQSTGRIFGAEEGTFAWWHEKGHLEYNKRPDTTKWMFYQGIVLQVWMLITTMALYYKTLALLSLLLITGYFLISYKEELWCNRYAREHFKDVSD